jgi:hypothetical protein
MISHPCRDNIPEAARRFSMCFHVERLATRTRAFYSHFEHLSGNSFWQQRR